MMTMLLRLAKCPSGRLTRTSGPLQGGSPPGGASAAEHVKHGDMFGHSAGFRVLDSVSVTCRPRVQGLCAAVFEAVFEGVFEAQ